MNSKTKKLNHQNNLLDREISKENQSVFTDMICYLRGSNIPEYDLELVRQDLTEMIISAQERGENISTVINGDYKEFCDNIIANLPPKTVKQKILYYVDVICWCLSILLAINIIISNETIAIIENIVMKKPVNFNITFSVGTIISIIFIIVIANVIVELVTKKVFDKRIFSKKNIFLFVAILIITAITIVLIGGNSLFTVNIFFACLLAVALFLAHKVLEAY